MNIVFLQEMTDKLLEQNGLSNLQRRREFGKEFAAIANDLLRMPELPLAQQDRVRQHCRDFREKWEMSASQFEGLFEFVEMVEAGAQRNEFLVWIEEGAVREITLDAPRQETTFSVAS